jgi:hypothetical protein
MVTKHPEIQGSRVFRGVSLAGHDQVVFGRDGAKAARLAFSRKRMTVRMVNLL